MEGDLSAESLQVYSGMVVALEKLTSEATVLAEHSKRIREHSLTLKTLNKSFNQVQSRLERVAAVRPGFSKIHI